jgi:peptidyl-prolyl cis-trans isomerase D
MLQLLRGKKSGLLVKIVLGLVVVAFSFFGLESYFVATTNTTVAKVGDHEISQDQFRERFNQYRQRMMQMSNGALDGSFFERPEVRQQVLDQLVNEQVLLDANDRLGMGIPPARVREEILAIPAFQSDGHFDADQYRMVLSSQGMTPSGFEQRVRQDLAVRELPLQVSDTALVTDAQLDTYLRLRDQRRDLRFLKLAKPAPAPGAGEVSEDEIAAYYKEHAAEFMVPERVALEYVELESAKLEVDTTPDDSVLQERYEKEKARFVTPEQRLASHILVKVDGKGTPEEQKQALAKAQAIEEQLKGGADFATVAKAESADLGSKNQGGDLGWLDRGMTDPAFEDALFALEKGQVSAPVLTSEGYHIIELRDLRAGETRSFEEVKPELAAEFAASERDRVYAEKAGRLTDLTYQDPSSLESAANELGIPVQKTPLFSRQGGEGIAGSPDVVKAAFSDSVLVQNNNSDPIEVAPGHVVVVRIAEHKAATPIPLDTVRETVRSRIAAEKASKQAKDAAEARLAKLEAGSTLEQLVEGEAKVETQKGVGRQAANVDSAIVRAAFTMPRPQPGKPSRKLVDLGGDQYALLVVDQVIDGDPASLDARTREAARTTLREGLGSVAAREFVDALRANTKITIAADKLQDL